jgi:hypothetical protein
MKLTIEENRVVFEQDPKNKWTLEIDKIKFIGEYTTNAGPIADDYFFVFADTVDRWWQAPTLSVDHEKFWKELGQRLKFEIAPGLFHSTTWATRVIYPKTLEGQELFKIVKTENKKQNFIQRLLGIGGERERIELTDNVKRLFSN